MPSETVLHFVFTSRVLFDPTIADGYMKHYVPISSDVAESMQAAAVTHVEGTINAHPFRRAVHLRPDGTKCLKFGKIWLEQAKLLVDMDVIIELSPDSEPDRIDLPEELTSALMEESDIIMQRWANLSPSRQKTLAYSIERAKRPETRLGRADIIIQALRENT